MEGLELTLLGVPRAVYQGEALEVQNKHLALICYVALLDRSSPRDELAELLWGPGGGGNLRTALYKLRQLPGAEEWLGDGELIEVHARSDVGLLERARGGEHLPDAVLTHLDAYVDADAGGLLFGLKAPTAAYGEWLEEQRQRVAALVDELLLGAAQDLHERGRHDRAKAYAEGLIARDPLDEAAYRLLMRIAFDSGRPENVHRTFERCRAALSELGGEPAPETLKLRRQLVGGGRGAQALLLRLGDRAPGQAARLFGRQALLTRLDAEARERPVLLHGFGGVGKTALAAELASSWLPKGNVLWLQAGSSSADELVAVAGQALSVEGAAQPETLRQTLERERVVLAVVDDVWSEDAVSNLRPYLPDGLPLVVTSRQRVRGMKRLDVGMLEREDARRLLAFEAGRELDEPGADSVCEVLGDHPFALRLAGAKLKHDRLTPQGLLAQLASAPHTLQTPKGWREEGRESVSALLQASLETLSDDAYDAFLAVGALSSGTVTAPLLSRVVRRDPEATEAALVELHTRALAERAASPGSDLIRYALHDLSHSFARQNTTLRTQTVLRACRDLVSAYPKDFETLDAEIANVVGALGAAQEAGDRQVLVDVMADLVVGEAYFPARGHTPRSLSLLETAVRWAKELGQLERAHALAGRLGDTYRVQYHDFARALAAYTEGARLARLTKNITREAILTSLCGISRHHLGEPPEEAFERAYQLARRAGDGLALGQILQHRGYVAYFYGAWAEMERFSAEAVEEARALGRISGVDQTRVDYNLFSALVNLGEARRKLGDFEGAVTLRKEALEIATARDNQMWQAYALHELGEMYLDVRHQEAERYLREALELYEANNAQAKIEQVRQLLSEQSSRQVDA